MGPFTGGNNWGPFNGGSNAGPFNGAQNNMDGFRPYAEKFTDVLGGLSENSGEEASPLLVSKAEIKKINIVLCTSDRGLCGGFNINLIDKAKELIKEKGADNPDFSFTNFGKKGRDWCRTLGQKIDQEYIGVVGSKFDFSIVSVAGAKLIDSFLNGDYDEVYIIYAQFVSVAKQLPVVKQLLPIPSIEQEDEKENDASAIFMAEHICEPSSEELLSAMLPKNVSVQIFSALLETSTSEHAARMSAMNNATTACNDMIDNLTLTYNKARQAAITADLMDIVGGAEALKG
jgi:F-type H+-transporting ATPase subunit gamma